MLNEMMKHGTTTVEIKTGYGLTLDAEIKMMEAIHELKVEEMMGIVPTFLGAHAVPPEYKEDPAAYEALVIEKMIPYIGKRKLALFCDVFCEQGYFDVDSSRRILEAGKAWGMAPKVHAEEITAFGGAMLAAQVGAVSADHLERIDDAGIAAMRDAGVVATLLPGRIVFPQSWLRSGPGPDRCRGSRGHCQRLQPRIVHVVLYAPDDDHRLHANAHVARGSALCGDTERGGRRESL